MEGREFQITPRFSHRVFFGRKILKDTSFFQDFPEFLGKKILLIFDKNFLFAVPHFQKEVDCLFSNHSSFYKSLVLPGGEESKKSLEIPNLVWKEILEIGLDRHSFVIVIGGGSLLDSVGFSVSTAHRGLRMVRFPTTTLSQADGGVGVKNGINLYGKKNSIGTFSVPYAVINDFSFLETQGDSLALEGIIEMIKVSLIKDADFFHSMESSPESLRDVKSFFFQESVKKSAFLHLEHIAKGGDPFEMENYRPLDFGHWVAHKLESMTRFKLSHGNAVSIGISVDCVYSQKKGMLSLANLEKILLLLKKLQLPSWIDDLETKDKEGNLEILSGIEEFRQHLGGNLSLLLLKDIGKSEEISEVDIFLLEQSIFFLKEWNEKNHCS